LILLTFNILENELKLNKKNYTMESFKTKLQSSSLQIKRSQTDILQINIGKVCNQACYHCHVESSPIRTENMNDVTLERLLKVLKASPSIKTVDITGGAPEMNPGFKKLVTLARSLNKEVIDRCNLSIFFEPKQENLPSFLADNQVHVIASLPCYSKDNVEKQRGKGVFNKSIEGLKILNNLGYAKKKDLVLDLVYNPVGPFLPPQQNILEQDYKKELKKYFNIEFNNLFTITNMPIKRFLDDLQRQNKLEEYVDLLVSNFNPHAAESVMCRNLISVGYDGQIYDCDFNQMLELPLGAGRTTIFDIESFDNFQDKEITFANHCFACTAGSGSSCGGSLA
jgi:radical SAM/Cys-rich protein